jgi:hypothetical protein
VQGTGEARKIRSGPRILLSTGTKPVPQRFVEETGARRIFANKFGV